MLAITKGGLSLVFLGLLFAVTSVIAIYESEAGIFDWHHTWIGHPRQAFKIDENHALVYSEKNIIASINTNSGAVDWRQVLENELDHCLATEVGTLTVSSYPERAQFWNNTNGQLIWEYTLPEEEHFGSAKPIVWENGDVAVLTGRSRVVKLSKEGNVLWEWNRKTNEEHAFERIQIIGRESKLYVIVETEVEAKSPYFVVNAIDRKTGETINNFKISCNADAENVAYVGDYLVWIEKDSLKWSSLEKKNIKSVSIKGLVAPLTTAEHFLPSKVIFTSDRTNPNLNSFILSTEYDLEDKTMIASVLVNINEKTMVLDKYFSEQIAFGGFDSIDLNTVRVVKTSPTEFTAYILPEGKEVKIQHDFALSGEINYIKTISLEPFCLFVVTEGSSIFYYNESSLAWSREEALSNIAATEFLDLPEKKMWTQMADELNESASKQASENVVSRYVRRLATHALELRRLPNWAISHFLGLTGSSINNGKDKTSVLKTQSVWLNESAPEMLYRDNFGLRKLLISVTRSGKIIAQDTSRNGKIVWSRYFGRFSFTDIHVVRTATVKLPPVIVAIADTTDEFGGPAVGFIRLNALTGEDYISSIPGAAQFFEPVVATNIGIDKVMRLPIEDPDERTHMLAIYESGTGRVYIYPDTNNAREKFAAEFLPNFYFSHQDEDGNLKGFKVVEGYRGSLKVMPVWNFDVPETELIVTSSKPQPYENVASLGRVLGNRNVLYKYLNPHMFAAIYRGDEDRQLMKVRIFDSVKGSILYENLHHNVDTETNEIHIIQSENWFIYHFWSNNSKSKGYQTVVLELFEGQSENERVASNNFSSFDNIQPNVLSSAFAFPYPVTTIGVTNTRNGISTKDLLFGLPNHQIMSVNKRLFDPRRPKDKPSKEDQEEMLIPYSPIPDEKRLLLTYGLDVANIRSIITSPSLLESTALVFAFGTDTFFTKSSPSKQFDVLSEDFSKAQLLFTITGLIVSIWISGPMVRRKRVNALWK